MGLSPRGIAQFSATSPQRGDFGVQTQPRWEHRSELLLACVGSAPPSPHPLFAHSCNSMAGVAELSISWEGGGGSRKKEIQDNNGGITREWRAAFALP